MIARWKPDSWKPDLRTLVSAVMIVLAFPPWNLWPLIWICLVPWFAALDQTPNVRGAVVQGLWQSFVMTIGGFFWIAFAISEFGDLPLMLSGLGVLIYAWIGQPQWIAFAAVYRKWGRPTSSSAGAYGLIISLAYVGLDWVLPKVFQDSLGHSLHNAPYLRQCADLGGVALLTLLVFWVNFGIYSAACAFRARAGSSIYGNFKYSLRHFALPLLACLVFWTYGLFRYQHIHELIFRSSAEGGTGVQVAAIQANIGDYQKVAAERGYGDASNVVLDSYSELTRQALAQQPRPQLVIWPETAVPSTFGTTNSTTERQIENRVRDLVTATQTPLLFGGYDTIRRLDFNSFFFLTPDTRLQVYHKSLLLFLGEYIPGAEFFPWIKTAFPQVGNFGRGNGPEVISVPYSGGGQGGELRVQPVICYEVLFSQFAIDAARKGSQAIFNITNDGWFGVWGEPQLHLALSKFRSIETRLPLVRSTNTGISAVVLQDGDMVGATGIGAKAVVNQYVPITPPIWTLMKFLGDWLGPTALCLALLGLVFLVNRRLPLT